jgi:hypothetical protein
VADVNGLDVRLANVGDPPVTIERLVGVYDADGTLVGELAYFVRARLGRAHCALCDITHGRVRERRDWQEQRARLPAPIELFHRDDQPEAARRASGSSLPTVLAETSDGRFHVLLSRTDLEACAGSPRRLVDAIADAVARSGLDW